MRAARSRLVAWVTWVLWTLAASDARSAGSSSGYSVAGALLGNVGGVRTDPLETSASVGIWRRLDAGALWLTDVDVTWLPAGEMPGIWANGPRLRRASTIATLGSGMDLHFPIPAGVAPFVGVRLGLGWGMWGDDRIDLMDGTRRQGGGEVALSGGYAVGLQVLTPRAWPSLRVAFQDRTIQSRHHSTSDRGFEARLLFPGARADGGATVRP